VAQELLHEKQGRGELATAGQIYTLRCLHKPSSAASGADRR
jgi:hypothetical protein